MKFWFRTKSGRDIDLEKPNLADINIEDIAASLSRQARFNGNTSSEAYSVAEHSVRVSLLVEEWTGDKALAMHGLMHDAAEWAIGDVVAPLKSYLRQFTKALDVLESTIELAIFKRFGVTHDGADIVKKADLVMLAGEWRDHVAAGTVPEFKYPARDKILPRPLDAEAAERAFLDRFEVLGGTIDGAAWMTAPDMLKVRSER